MTVTVVGPEPSGLATLVAELIQQNLAREPERRRLLRTCVAVLDAPDAEVTLHLRIGPDAVRVGDGSVPDAHLRVRADADRLLQLTTVPLRFGWPDVLRPEGRAIVRDLIARRLAIRGLVTHPIRVARLTRLLSVADGGQTT